MNQLQFHIDVRDQDTEESLAGFPKYADNQVRAHAIAEEAVRELVTANEPGEYIVIVSFEGKDPISSQLVVVRPHPS